MRLCQFLEVWYYCIYLLCIQFSHIKLRRYSNWFYYSEFIWVGFMFFIFKKKGFSTYKSWCSLYNWFIDMVILVNFFSFLDCLKFFIGFLISNEISLWGIVILNNNLTIHLSPTRGWGVSWVNAYWQDSALF